MSKIVSEYHQEIPQSQTADKSMAPRVYFHVNRYSKKALWGVYYEDFKGISPKWGLVHR